MAPINLSNSYSQNFDTLINSGSGTFVNDPTTDGSLGLSGWYAARTGNGTTIVANDGSSNTGNLYSYGSTGSTDRALGSIGSASAGNFFWGVRLLNNTSNTITGLNIGYTGEQWRYSGTAAAQTIDFQYQVAAPSLTGGNWIDFNDLDFTSPIINGTAGALNGNASANRTILSKTLSGLSVAPGQEIWLRWSDPDHPGSDHGLAIDDFSVSAVSGATPNPNPNPNPTPTYTKISTIQGSGSTFANGGTQSIEGIVVGSFPGASKLNGFYVEEEDADQDSNSTTSEGIFVFDPNGLFTGKVGDKVQVTGTVTEYTSGTVGSSLTQINASTVNNLGASTLPTVVNIKLPVTSVSDLERYEGMLVNVSAATGDLTVDEQFQLGRFGQVLLAANGPSNQPGTDARIDQYTQFNAPSVSGNTAYQQEIAKREIYVDDGSGSQNPDPVIFGRGGQPLSASNTLRGGDTVNNITGVLDQRFEGYRIQTSSGVNFQPTNPRPTTVPDVGGTLKVASANVLNFFTDLDTNSVITIPNGVSFEPRGANTSTEFTRQRNKIIANLNSINADVLGLMEIENNGSGPNSAIANLVSGLNDVAGAGTYAFINDTNLVNDPNAQPNAVGTDAIKVALIYKPGKVTPVLAQPLSYKEPDPNNPIFSRPPIAETFQQNSNGEKFSIIVNHFKSKSATGATGLDLDQGDGQGAYNNKRSQQAQAMVDFANTVKTAAGDNDVLIVGDLNAYAKEDPITILAGGGYTNLLSYDSYSYVFDGQWGSLDHQLANASLSAQVTGAAKYHINADEPIVLDYNTEFKSTAQQSSLYSPDQYRSSDHDPVVVGLNLYTVNNTYDGSNTRDPITGAAGNDQITGGSGAKTITGGTGSNQYVFKSLKDVGQTITDFTPGRDKIVLADLLDSLVTGGYKGADAIADGYVQLVAGSTANSTILQVDRDGPLGSAVFRPFLELSNVTPTAMNNISNFVF